MRLFKIFPALLLLPLSVMAASSVWTGKVAKEFASGIGKNYNPYIIETAEQFALMAEKYADTLYFKLANDIVLNTGDAKDWAKKAPKNKWIVYGDTSKYARVRLDGAGHYVSGLFVNSDKDFQGLFGIWKGTVTNVVVKNSYIKGRSNVGSLAGLFFGDGIKGYPSVYNVSVDVFVEGDQFVGGLFGSAGYTCEKCEEVFPQESMSGYNYIRNISVSGSVEGNNYVGGLAGASGASYSTGNFRGFVNRAAIKGLGDVGGFSGYLYFDVPYDSSTIRDLINYGDIEGEYEIGGLVGSVHEGRSMDDVIFENAINLGNVVGKKSVGGIFGLFPGWSIGGGEKISLRNGYNAGKVKGVSAVSPLFHCERCDEACQDSLHLFDFFEASPSSIAQHADSLGAYFIPDTGATPVNKGYPLLVYYHMDKLYNHGSGTRADPYLIESLHDLRRFERHAEIVIDSLPELRYFRQEADIVLPEEKNNWNPINGYFIDYDGNGHSISNLNIRLDVNVDSLMKRSGDFYTKYCDKEEYSPVGLFAYLYGSRIQSLTLHDVDIVGCRSVGAFWSGEGGYGNQFENVTVDGSVSGVYEIGGITGGGNATLYHATNYADVKGVAMVCGISNGDLYYTRNYGNVTGRVYVGGISSYTFNRDALNYVFNRGAVSGRQYVGGLTARIDPTATVRIQHSYNASTVTGNEAVGSILGYTYERGEDTIYGPALYDKTLSDNPAIGRDSLVVYDSLLGMDSKSLKSSTALKILGPAFKEDSDNENDGYPVFYTFKGRGSENDPYIISSAEELRHLSRMSNEVGLMGYFCSKYFKVTADIDLKASSKDPWIPLFVYSNTQSKFTGTFDGGGHTISGIYTDSLDNAGLFAFSNGVVKNVGIAKSTIRGAVAASVVAINRGVIENCWNESASISGRIAGGIAGTFEADSVDRYSYSKKEEIARRKLYIDRSYNAGEVNGKAYAGGIVGSMGVSMSFVWATLEEPNNYVSVANSYNVGMVKSDSGQVAGLVAYVDRVTTMEGSSVFTLKNLYNAVDVCAAAKTVKCSPTVLIQFDWEAYVNNVFYLGSPDKTFFGEAKSSKEMKSKDFVSLLGDAFAYDSKGVNDGFPILSGKGSFDPYKYDEGQSVPPPLVYKALQVSVVGREIYLDNLVDGVNTVLFDLRGKRVWSGAGKSAVIPVQKAGIYIIRNKFQMAKIVVR